MFQPNRHDRLILYPALLTTMLLLSASSLPAQNGGKALETAQAFMNAMGSGDFETVGALMADDMVWHNEGDPSIPWIGTWRGKQAILGEFFPAYGAGASTKMWSVDHASGDDREAVMTGRMSLLLNNSGLETGPTSWAVKVQVENGKVKHWHWFEDSDLFSRTFHGETTAADVARSTHRDLVQRALRATLLGGDVEAVDQFFGPQYIQHNPDVPNGLEAFKGLVGALSQNPDFRADVFRVLVDGDHVATHSIYYGFAAEPMVAFDVFRLENGKIVEHWDNLLPVALPNPSGRSQVDGATKVTDLDKTDANKAKVREFVEKVLIRHEEVRLTDYISPTTYLQHNPVVADGLQGFGAFMQEMAAQGIQMEYKTLHKVIGEGNFVLTLSEGTFGGAPKSYYDLFRLEDGLIVEHWDIIADMPGADAKHNEAGKF